MRSLIISLILSVVFLATFQACEEGPVSSDPEKSEIGPLYVIEVTPPGGMIEVDSTQQFVALGRDANMKIIQDLAYSWTSRYPNVASIDENGLLTAKSSGVTFITAKSGSIETVQISVSVYDPVFSIVISPDTLTLDYGTTGNLLAIGKDMNGDNITGLSFEWELGNTSIATVNNTGVVTGIGVGNTTVKASLRDVESLLTVIIVNKSIPVVSTDGISEITESAATASGKVISNGGADISTIGICWSKTDPPTVSDYYHSTYGDTGSFSMLIDELTAETIYYVRAYAKNEMGTGYGNTLSFTTLGRTTPTLTTEGISNITPVSATCEAEVTSDGGTGYIYYYGVCWSTSPSPTTSDSYIEEYGNVGGFYTKIIGLIPETTYYVRAYAKNSEGTGYGNELSFSTSSFETSSVTDVDGNTYETIRIGGQWWMAENLKVTHYRNGDQILHTPDSTEWTTLSEGSYCIYNNDQEISGIYGALYNWYAVDDSRNIAPDGWHVPSSDDWTTLISTLGGEYVAGGKMKEVGTEHWAENHKASNESGFTGLPGGYRGYSASYRNLGGSAYFWSSTSSSSYRAFYLRLNYYNDDIYFSSNNGDFRIGYSIRCVKD